MFKQLGFTTLVLVVHISAGYAEKMLEINTVYLDNRKMWTLVWILRFFNVMQCNVFTS
jgi:hypothetical protein